MEAAIHGCDQRSPVVEFNHPRLEEALHLEQRGADSGGFVQGTSSVLWPAAQRMAQFLLDTQAETLPGRSLLELGAGVGLVGAACAACGARAVLTDWEGALPLLRRNAELLAQRGVMVEVARLDWGSADQEAILADTPGGFDLLVGSDIILSSFAPGFRIIADFCTEPVWRVLESLFGAVKS
ncbi:unnamed protein product [Effrenium voratum]|nr:unnamed protein product [Effrenium voratum]CAJ1446694.1 unnamed protein product [Effrenium voratum]